jgi:hypothetical protein
VQARRFLLSINPQFWWAHRGEAIFDGPQGQSYFLKAQGDYKKHALSYKARTAVLYATSPRSSQVEVPNILTIGVGVQGRMTRGYYGDGISKAIENSTSPQMIFRKA